MNQNRNSRENYSNQPSKGKKSGICFLICVINIIALEYAGYVFIILWPIITKWYGILLGALFHIFFILLVCAFYKSVVTDPGTVPANWGFYFGDENKRRRYCKVCHVWKPDRTHHCSACGHCVLNMDHHCPWINNCVGFFNRKFFIQLLFYALICLLFASIHGLVYLLMEGGSVVHGVEGHGSATSKAIGIVTYVCACIILVFSLVLVFALVPFTRFHLGLVTRNSTTIENMDPNTRDRSTYDLGSQRNCEQVFGRNSCLWWFPGHTRTSRPYGDGVRWRLDYRRAVEEEYSEMVQQPTASRPNTYNNQSPSNNSHPPHPPRAYSHRHH